MKQTEYSSSLINLFPEIDYGLTESEYSLMVLLGINGEMGVSDIKRHLYKTTQQRDADLKTLLDKGFIIRVSAYYNNTYFVRDDIFLTFVLNSLLYHYDCITSLQRTCGYYISTRWNLVYSIYKGKEDIVRSYLKWNINAFSYELFYPVMTHPAFRMIFENMEEGYLEKLTANYLETALAFDELNEQVLSRASEFTQTYLKSDEMEVQLAMVATYRFFFDGSIADVLLNRKKWNEWSLAVAAILALYKGEYEQAGALFEASLKCRNKTASIKNVYNSLVLSYYLMICYVLQDSEKSKAKITQYLNKKRIDFTSGTNAAAFFLANIVQGNGEKYLEQIIKDISIVDAPTIILMVKTIAEHFKVRNILAPRENSNIGIIRHEFLGEKGAFDGEPLLGRIKIKEIWEIALDNLLSIVEKKCSESSLDTANVKRKRLIYIVDDYSFAIKEQHILKNGTWSAGTNISTYSFIDGVYDDICDEQDKSIKSVISSRSYCEKDDIFPYLIGSDRVFEKCYSPENQIKIVEEKPYIEVKLTSSSNYSFLTNVPIERTGHIDRHYVKKEGKNKYAVISLSKVQAEVFAAIFFQNNTKFPVNSAEYIKQFLTKLSSIIEIHSPLLETGSSLESRPSQSHLYLRVIPKAGAFQTQLYVRPLEGGLCTFFPGEGKSVVYDSINEVRYQVKRNKDEEINNLKHLSELCDNIVFEEDGNILAADELLTIVEKSNELSDFCTIEWPESKPLKVIGSLQSGKVNITVNSHEKWFELEGDAQLKDNTTLSLASILNAISLGEYNRGFLKLGENEFASLSSSLYKYLSRLASITQNTKGHEKVSIFQVGALSEALDKARVQIQGDEQYASLQKRIEQASRLVPSVPNNLNAVLRDYQVEGFRWLARLDYWGAGGCLADDMGLGKTVQTIAFLLYKAEAGPSLVVMPASVMVNWYSELSRFAPSLRVIPLNEQSDRKKALEGLGPNDVVLATYGLLIRENQIVQTQWNVVCLDEAHTIKNRGTKMSAVAMQLNAKSRIILTGTPVQNNLGELWNMFQFLNPGLLGSYESFQAKFINPIESSQDDDTRQKLKRIIQPFMLRRLKSEVVDELPEKTDIIRNVELTDEESIVYESLRLSAKRELEEQKSVNINVLAAITKLRRAACAVSLVNPEAKAEPSKITELKSLLNEILEGDDSVLVFSQFTSFLDIVCKYLDEEHIDYFYLNGAVTLKKRQEMVDAFQRKEKRVFLISLKAGGLGLNLTNANYIIHLDPWWNPAIEQQATDRAYRIGQKRNVTVYHLIAKGTIEEKILRLHKTKRDLASAILEGTSEATSMTIDQLKELVEMD